MIKIENKQRQKSKNAQSGPEWNCIIVFSSLKYVHTEVYACTCEGRYCVKEKGRVVVVVVVVVIVVVVVVLVVIVVVVVFTRIQSSSSSSCCYCDSRSSSCKCCDSSSSTQIYSK